jgi:hypothetical protein
MAAVFPFSKSESRPFRQGLGARVDHLVANRLMLGSMGHQTQRISRGPIRKSSLVHAELVTERH